MPHVSGGDFLTERPQSVRVGNNTSNSIMLNTGSPQGCVLSPLLFTLLIHDCASRHKGNQIIKFADDTTVVGLIHRSKESIYREEVKHLEVWCRENNLVFNAGKTKEMVIDFQRSQPVHAPLSISGRTAERMENIRFLRVQTDLNWNKTTSGITKWAQQRLDFLRKLKQASLPINILRTFYIGVVESVLMYCILTWYSSCSMSDKKALQRIVRGSLEFSSPLSKNTSKAAAGTEHRTSSGMPSTLSTHS